MRETRSASGSAPRSAGPVRGTSKRRRPMASRVPRVLDLFPMIVLAALAAGAGWSRLLEPTAGMPAAAAAEAKAPAAAAEGSAPAAAAEGSAPAAAAEAPAPAVATGATAPAAAGGTRTGAATAGGGAARAEGRWFEDVTKRAGLAVAHHNRVFHNPYADIMAGYTALGAAAAAADYDGDGYEDLFVTDSSEGGRNHLYHNNGDLTFTDMAEAAGVAAGNDAENATADAIRE